MEVLEDFELTAEGADEDRALDGLDELRLQAKRARTLMVLGVVVAGPVVEPLAFVRALRLLAELRQSSGEDLTLRRQLRGTAAFAGMLTVLWWTGMALWLSGLS
jgi:hypothetical protein